MTSWNSYGKVYALGHRGVKELFEGPVTIEEKIDGSQFSFGLIEGELCVRSRGRVFDINEGLANEGGMFHGACVTVQRLFDENLLTEGITYRGEVLSKPKHNVQCYGRVPRGNIILWDVATADQDYITYAAKCLHAAALDLEIVPLFFSGVVTDQAQLDELKSRTSILGGPIEGFVVKNYERFDSDGKLLKGKWVSEKFREVHRKAGNSGSDRPVKQEVMTELAKKYSTPARWHKAVQHLREADKLVNAPQDIGPLLKEVPRDLLAECIDEIKEDLFNRYWPGLRRACTSGLPEWYLEELEKGTEEND